MRTILPFNTLFQKFITDTLQGKRLKKNGERISVNSVENYKYVRNNIIKFSLEKCIDLHLGDVRKLTKREFESEKNYWKKFYKSFTEYLYKNGCHDNYVGANIKVIRTFFNYLKEHKNIDVGDFHKQFYIRKEQVEIFVLNPEQLKFLIHDREFENTLSPKEKFIKDAFVFGCTTSLRFSDLFLITNKNIDFINGSSYLKIKSKKTKTFTNTKLPNYAVDIYNRHKSINCSSPLFKKLSLYDFNKNLKKLGEKAGFVNNVDISREQQGKARVKRSTKQQTRFCDIMSSHMMRRTAITMHLVLGMPEHLVRKISGHSGTSSSFSRYVHYAQSYMDSEIEKVYQKLDNESTLVI